MKVFPVHHSSCKVVCYFLSFDLDRLGDLEKDRDGLRFLSWDSDLSLLLYLLKGPAPAAGEASPSWRSVARGRTPPPIIISRATTPRRRQPRFRLLLSPFDRSTLTRQPQSVRPSTSQTATAASRGSSFSTRAKPGGFLATHTLRSGP